MKQPLKKGYITTAFIKKDGHYALDIGWVSDTGKTTTELYAVADGEVIVSKWFDTGSGYQVALDIPSGNPAYKYMVKYVHLKSLAVKKGDKVTKGQLIGIGDSTGISSGPHLHIETWKVPIGFKYTGIVDSSYIPNRNKYAVNPADLINFETTDANKKTTLYKYTEMPIDKIATTKEKDLNMRDYPSTVAFSVGYMKGELKAVAITSKVRGYEWVKCQWQDRFVYIVKDYLELKDAECEPIIIEVEKPFKETITVGELEITIERKVEGK